MAQQEASEEQGCSLSSEEELLEGEETPGGSSPTAGSPDPTALLCPPRWAGWLDKMAPQGHYLYQRRWVTLDSQCLRYFASDKDVFSKRFILISSISHVAAIGEQKFEVVTQSRHFVFRADSDADRSQWLWALQSALEERQERMGDRAADPNNNDPISDPISDPIGDPIGDPEGAEAKCGQLELRGFKHGVFVVLRGGALLLYRNREEQQQGLGITRIPMALGSVRDAERRSFQLRTPYGTFRSAAARRQKQPCITP
ncbi:arf-GAP with Rho-GAP domain, ANK repeat and PH domain-containing protein 1-like [Tympanuchus pallidicinctus]|uniref:arf-GAP with Rho-GAP domain, ANK repeat and PH domain-containing protein 1-like n=1 Tax=Tympanuchus pallidicinctus TaxID=109042 RepID=UPI002287025C|nr:arf-GAP with Rho-GAP domain, ANK repeat and PH domain-containing protein 1-like [Tympanuchus pallidicinctus]